MPRKATKTKSSKSAKTVKTSRAKKSTAPVMDMPMMEPVVESMPMSTVARPPMPMMSPRVLRIALIVILAALATYKLGPWLFPAVVGNTPVSRFTVWNKMEKAYGQMTLDEVVNEKVLDQAIAKRGVSVDQAKVDTQMAELETQFESLGGLDEALKQRGLSRADLQKQVVTQLSVEEILKDKVTPTEEETRSDYDENKETLYADKEYEEVQEEITARLRDTKLRDAFLEWFAEVKKEVNVRNFGL